MAQAVWVNGSRTLTITLNTTEAPELNALLSSYNLPTTVPAADAMMNEGAWSHLIDVLKELQFLGLGKSPASPDASTQKIRKNH